MFLSICIIVIFSTFPLLLWGYGTTYLSTHLWNRARFLFGLLAGGLSVFVISFFGKVNYPSFIEIFITFLFIYGLLGLFTWYITSKGSPFIKGFLRKVLLVHIFTFAIIIITGLFIRKIFPQASIFSHITLISIGGLFLAASIEEGAKHVSTLGLTAKEFRFTRRDFLLFTFFVTLGFVTLENAIFMISKIGLGSGSVFITGITRLLFSLPIHVFASSLCVMLWWKALSYKLFSGKYIFFFVLGYVGATLVHGAYNIFIESSILGPIIVLVGVGYFSFTEWLTSDDEN